MIDVDIETVLDRQQHSDIPPVTVTISLYNYQDYILQCLESVKSQTYASRFAKCALLRHRQNQGLGTTRNTAFYRARTLFVFVLDADNVLYPRCIERLRAALEHSTASFAYCYLEKFGGQTALQNVRAWNPAKLQHGNTIDAMVLMRRDAWQKVGGYAMQMPSPGWEDFDFWFRLAKISGWGVLVPEILARYRVHSQSMLRTVTYAHEGDLWKYLRAAHPEFFASLP
jgi:glycosyltransferase involved in cell wall biosynthesis